MSKVGESNKKPLAMLRPNASLGDALSLLIQDERSSLSKLWSSLLFWLDVKWSLSLLLQVAVLFPSQ